jgi:hypothetical protein
LGLAFEGAKLPVLEIAVGGCALHDHGWLQLWPQPTANLEVVKPSIRASRRNNKPPVQVVNDLANDGIPKDIGSFAQRCSGGRRVASAPCRVTVSTPSIV